MGPYAVVDYNFRRQSRLQHIYHGQTYARVDLKPLSPSHGEDLASVFNTYRDPGGDVCQLVCGQKSVFQLSLSVQYFK